MSISNLDLEDQIKITQIDFKAVNVTYGLSVVEIKKMQFFCSVFVAVNS